MWLWIGIGGGLLYLTLFFTLGLVTARNGHGWMVFFGIFFPLLWLVGATMEPKGAQPQVFRDRGTTSRPES